MSVELSNHSGGGSCAREALAEIRAYSGGLQAFVSSIFDQLSGLTDELLAREFAHQQAQQQSEREALKSQIERLASVADELTRAMVGQKQLAGQKDGSGTGLR